MRDTISYVPRREPAVSVNRVPAAGILPRAAGEQARSKGRYGDSGNRAPFVSIPETSGLLLARAVGTDISQRSHARLRTGALPLLQIAQTRRRGRVDESLFTKRTVHEGLAEEIA
jgi:hypothetical protein